MPQATDELRAKWGISEEKAMEHLESRGYILTPDWCWFKPANIIPTEEDFSAANFLIQEWDFGGIIANKV